MVSRSVFKRKIQTDSFPDAIDHEEYYSERFLEVFRRVVVVQSLSRIRLFVTPWTAARQASLSITNPEFTQTHVHLVSVAIQPSHPLLSPSSPTFNLSQSQGLIK